MFRFLYTQLSRVVLLQPYMKVLNKIFLFASLWLVSQNAYAQIGFTGAYYQQQIPEWETAVFGERSNEDFLKTGYSFGIDYWLKPIENYRIEFYPEVLVNYTSADITRDALTESFDLASIGLNLNTNIYVLNIESDCDCPTFSKQESFFEKGFFIQISPGVHYLKGTYNYAADNTLQKNKMSDIVPKLGIGLGLDIGISDFITLTPIVKYNRYFNAEWDGLVASLNEPTSSIVLGNNKSNINQFYAGLHIGIRWKQ